MAVHTTLNLADFLPVTLTAPELTEEGFVKLCQKFPEATIEFAHGEVVIMPPTDFRSNARTFEVGRQLGNWALEKGGGIVAGMEGGFLFPDGSRRSPDAVWCDEARWKAAERPHTRYPVFAPDFVIEVRSPEQRVRALHEKMDEYIANGVKLAWLVDPIDRTVSIYRPGQEPEVLHDPVSVAGEGPVGGFVLELGRVFG
jgi:Uma2 family endonuclease